MKFLCISDTHNAHDQLDLGPADVSIHAGDATSHGTREECEAFLRWFRTLPYEHKIFVPGNHDTEFLRVGADMDLSGMHVLVHDEITIGGIRIVGTCQREQKVLERWVFDPGPDLLITHYTPKKILDTLVPGMKKHKKKSLDPEYLGNASIARLVEQLRPKTHLFGHVHEYGGHSVEIAGTMHMNLACFNEDYEMARPRGVYLEL